MITNYLIKYKNLNFINGLRVVGDVPRKLRKKTGAIWFSFLKNVFVLK